MPTIELELPIMESKNYECVVVVEFIKQYNQARAKRQLERLKTGNTNEQISKN
jgi:hypothetical protein